MSRRGLAWQIGLVTTLVAVLSVGVAAIVSTRLVRDAVVAGAQTRLARDADLAAALTPKTLTAVRGRRLLRAGGISIDLIGPAGGQTGSLQLDAADVATLLGGADLSGQRTVGGQTLVVEGRPLADGGAVAVAEPVGLSAATNDRIRRAELFALIAGAVVGLGAGVLLARRLARPLRVAAGAAHRLAAGDRDVRLSPEGPAEVVEVSAALARLAAGLSESENRQRDFLLSVSHELRTPLTAVRGYAEALADGVTTGDGVQPAAATIVAEAQRLDLLVTDLLDLARLDAQDLRITRSSVDVGAVVAAAADAWRGRCDAAGVPLSTELPAEPVHVDTDAGRVRQIVENLLANALRVTPSGRPIVLAVRRATTGGAVVEVRDGGPGLADADLAVAFDRGVLHERYRGVRPVGTGLGLAIVGRLAGRLGGRASAGHAPEGGACFRVELP